jgi:hypothetical protein
LFLHKDSINRSGKVSENGALSPFSEVINAIRLRGIKFQDVVENGDNLPVSLLRWMQASCRNADEDEAGITRP